MKYLNHLILALILLLAVGCDPAPRQAPAAGGKVQRLMLISLDGARPDVLLRGEAPNVRELCRRGSFTFWATTIDWTVTLPSHTSMITGVTPEKHGIWTNSDWPVDEDLRPNVPTLFQLAKAAGFTTAMAAGKAKFAAFNAPGALDWCYVPEYHAADLHVAQQAVDMIRQHQPQVMMVHLPGLDGTGHRYGWGSDQQLAKVREVDMGVGMVLGALRQCGLLESTVVILTADHGGIGRSHWTKDARTLHIPWVVAGPGIRENVDLAQHTYLTINTCDTFATACDLLGIPVKGEIDGKVIRQIRIEPDIAPMETFRSQWSEPDNANSMQDDQSADDDDDQDGDHQDGDAMSDNDKAVDDADR